MQIFLKGGFRARMITFGALALVSFSIILGWPLQAISGAFNTEILQSPSNGFQLVKIINKPSIGGRCIRTRKRLGRFELVNQCSMCRSVQIQHTRPNNRPAILRDYYMPPKETVILPFRGKGRTRVLTDSACERNDRRAKSAEKRSQSCVRMRRDTRGLMLINICSVCKTGVVERLFNGGRSDQKRITIASNSFSAVTANGARSARLVSEVPCR